MKEQTYAYETNPDSDKLLEIKKQEIKELKKKAAKDKKFRLAKSKEKRDIRNDKLDRINIKLKTIKEKMVYYNRAGKKEKDGIDILSNICSMINNDVELAEEIERTKPSEDPEIRELEAEAFVQPEGFEE